MERYFAADMVDTPWGKTQELRADRLRPGPGRPRQLVRRHQRHRLFAAMVASTTAKGYPATTVADLIALAGVSRGTFYQHFEDKDACFRATAEELFAEGLGLLQATLEGEAPVRDCGRLALSRLLRLVASQPAASRMALVDAYSAGPAGLEPINAAFEEVCEMIHRALRELHGREDVPEQLSRAIVGGIHRILYLHLYRGEERALEGLGEVLWEWATAYPPPGELSKPARRRGHAEAGSPPRGRDPHERILRGFAAAVAAHGYADVTVPKVTAETGISNATFYQHFENKEDAMLAALDLSGAQLTAAALPAARREATWPEAVRRALQAMCGFLALEPAFARLRTMEVFSAGPEPHMHRDRAWKQVLEELVPEEIRESNRAVIEASSGAVYGLLYERVRRGELDKVRELFPLLTYLVLTPLIGAGEATRVAAARP